MFSKRDKKIFRKYVPLLLIVVLGMVLRLNDLLEKSLWYDEVFSVGVSNPNNSLSEVFHQTVEDVHPPFYQILLWLVFHVFGYEEWVARVFSVVLGVALIPSIYCLGRKLFNERVGMIAALLSSVDFVLIALSRDARSYSLLVFFGVVSFLFFFRVVERKNVREVCLYTAFASLLVNTHYFGFFLVMAQFIFLLYFSVRTGLDRRLFIASCAAALGVALSLIPVLSYMLENFKKTDTWIRKPEDGFLVEWFTLLFGNQTIALICGMFMVFALMKLLVVEDRKDSLKLLLVWWFLGFTVAWLRSSLFTPILSFRNMVVFVPVILIFVAYGFSLVRDDFVRWMLLVFVCVMSISFYLMSPDYSKLRIEHDLRSPVKKIIGEAKNVPVYAGAIYAGYFNILGSSIRPLPYEVLIAELTQKATPPCFYVIDIDQVHDESERLTKMLVEHVKYQNNSIALYGVKEGHGCEPVINGP